MNDSGKQHDEIKAMLYIVILNLQVVEIGIIFEVIIVGFNRPAPFIVNSNERCLSRQLSVKPVLLGIEFCLLCRMLPEQV